MVQNLILSLAPLWMKRTSTMPSFFFFNDTATTEISTLSLHDALPIWPGRLLGRSQALRRKDPRGDPGGVDRDRKSTRLNSSHVEISYALFFFKKKKKNKTPTHTPQPPHTTHLLPPLALER